MERLPPTVPSDTPSQSQTMYLALRSLFIAFLSVAASLQSLI